MPSEICTLAPCVRGGDIDIILARVLVVVLVPIVLVIVLIRSMFVVRDMFLCLLMLLIVHVVHVVGMCQSRMLVPCT